MGIVNISQDQDQRGQEGLSAASGSSSSPSCPCVRRLHPHPSIFTGGSWAPPVFPGNVSQTARGGGEFGQKGRGTCLCSSGALGPLRAGALGPLSNFVLVLKRFLCILSIAQKTSFNFLCNVLVFPDLFGCPANTHRFLGGGDDRGVGWQKPRFGNEPWTDPNSAALEDFSPSRTWAVGLVPKGCRALAQVAPVTPHPARQGLEEKKGITVEFWLQGEALQEQRGSEPAGGRGGTGAVAVTQFMTQAGKSQGKNEHFQV